MTDQWDDQRIEATIEQRECGFLGGSVARPRRCVLPEGHDGFHAEALIDAESSRSAMVSDEVLRERRLVQMWAQRLDDPVYVNALDNLRLHIEKLRTAEKLNRIRGEKG